VNPELDPYILQQASCRARVLVSTAGFRRDDWEDLRQEMILDFLRRAPKFDPARGKWRGFVRGVMKNHAAILITRKYRSWYREVVFSDVRIGEAESGEAVNDYFDGLRSHETGTALRLSIDVERMLNRLPSQLRTLALLLGEMPVQDVCALMGKSRSRVYQMTCQLRDAFAQAGFRPCRSTNSLVE
jgi:RNA polymerase sigma-70 factor, ECF subfamily